MCSVPRGMMFIGSVHFPFHAYFPPLHSNNCALLQPQPAFVFFSLQICNAYYFHVPSFISILLNANRNIQTFFYFTFSTLSLSHRLRLSQHLMHIYINFAKISPSPLSLALLRSCTARIFIL